MKDKIAKIIYKNFKNDMIKLSKKDILKQVKINFSKSKKEYLASLLKEGAVNFIKDNDLSLKITGSLLNSFIDYFINIYLKNKKL